MESLVVLRRVADDTLHECRGFTLVGRHGDRCDLVLLGLDTHLFHGTIVFDESSARFRALGPNSVLWKGARATHVELEVGGVLEFGDSEFDHYGVEAIAMGDFAERGLPSTINRSNRLLVRIEATAEGNDIVTVGWEPNGPAGALGPGSSRIFLLLLDNGGSADRSTVWSELHPGIDSVRASARLRTQLKELVRTLESLEVEPGHLIQVERTHLSLNLGDHLILDKRPVGDARALAAFAVRQACRKLGLDFRAVSSRRWEVTWPESEGRQSIPIWTANEGNGIALVIGTGESHADRGVPRRDATVVHVEFGETSRARNQEALVDTLQYILAQAARAVQSGSAS